MVQFSCDSCQALKTRDELWILGLAAEAVGFTAARREVNILSSWDYNSAVHPLAVHFCSESCKENYIDKLFGKTEGVASVPQKQAKLKVRSRVKKLKRQVA